MPTPGGDWKLMGMALDGKPIGGEAIFIAGKKNSCIIHVLFSMMCVVSMRKIAKI